MLFSSFKDELSCLTIWSKFFIGKSKIEINIFFFPKFVIYEWMKFIVRWLIHFEEDYPNMIKLLMKKKINKWK